MTARGTELSAAEHWARHVLGMSARPTATPLRTALADAVRQRGFTLCEQSAEAVEILSGRTPTRDPLADETHFQRFDEAKHLRDVEQFAIEFGSLSTADRRERWDELRRAGDGIPIIRGRLARLEFAIDLPAFIPGDALPDAALQILSQYFQTTLPNRRDEMHECLLRFLSDARLKEMMAAADAVSDIQIRRLLYHLKCDLRRRAKHEHQRIARLEEAHYFEMQYKAERRGARFRDEYVEPEVLTVLDVIGQAKWLDRAAPWILVSCGLMLVAMFLLHATGMFAGAFRRSSPPIDSPPAPTKSSLQSIPTEGAR